MTTLSLVDYLMTGPPRTPDHPMSPDLERALQVADAMAREALAEYNRLDALDLELGKRNGPGQFDRQAALLMTAAFEEWADRADALLRRVAKLHRRGQSVARADELRDAAGRTRAMLTVNAEDLDVTREELRQGKGIPGEVVRRDLLNRICP